MFDLLVFTNHPEAYAPRRFAEEATLKGSTFKVINYEDVDLRNLPDAKYIILREPNPEEELYKLRDKILKHYLSINSKILNSNSYLTWPRFDKMTQTNEFQKSGISCLKNLKLEDVKYPYIIKNKLGSHGNAVFKINDKKDLDQALLKYKKEDLIIQEFQTSGFDLRIIVLGNKVLGIMKRTPKKGEFLSNYSQGGNVESYKDTSDKVTEIEKIAIRTAKHFQLDYCGVDLMKGNDNKWKILEVNRACQFQGFEKSLKINVAKEVLNFLRK